MGIIVRIIIVVLVALTFLGPLSILSRGGIDFNASYLTANRESARIAPDPKKTPEAVIQVYAARTFNWRGIFAVHTWIATKPKNGTTYTVYQKIGWLYLRGLPPVLIKADIPDRYWFNSKPTIIKSIYGKQAEKLIPEIERAAKNYPFPNEYNYWPGPNSNTFIAYIARQVPELRLALPSNAIGKDYLSDRTFVAVAPSGTGYQISILGVFGITIAKIEGVELNFLGLVYGFSPATRTIKLPGFGDIHF